MRLPDVIEKRSVINQIHSKIQGTVHEAVGIVSDERGLRRLVWQLAGYGLKAECAALVVLLPLDYEEAELRKKMNAVDKLLTLWGIPVEDIATSAESAFSEISILVRLKGQAEKKVRGRQPLPEGARIIAVGYAGLEATEMLLERRSDEIAKAFSAGYAERLKGAAQALGSPEAAAELAADESVLFSIAAGEGGIFAALNKLADEGKCGFRVKLNSIPIRQETIEVMNLLDIDPYETFSTGVMLYVTDDFEKFSEKIFKKGVHFSEIGGIIKGNIKILEIRDEERCLDNFRSDPLVKMGV